MKKIIFLLIFFAVLIIIPSGKIYGAQYFVGVTIDSASTPGYPSGTNYNWCLPNGSTIEIKEESSPSWYNTIAYIAMTKPGCAGTTFWSNVVDLDSGINYRISIQAGGYYGTGYCPGYYEDYTYTCWVSWEENKTCNEVCSHYGTTPYFVAEDEIANYQDSWDCVIESFLMGEDCSTCSEGTYNYYDLDDNSCKSSHSPYAGDDGNNPNVGYVRVCPCEYQYSNNLYFDFPFTLNF